MGSRALDGLVSTSPAGCPGPGLGSSTILSSDTKMNLPSSKLEGIMLRPGFGR